MKFQTALLFDAEPIGEAGQSHKRTHSGRFTELDPLKLRGGYYTPGNIAAWLCAWAIRNPSDNILEPSCGDGIFLEHAAARLISLGADRQAVPRQLTGVEIIESEATTSEARLRARLEVNAGKVIVNDDFFSWFKLLRSRNFDAVIGNPPFLRYQTFPEPHRSRAMAMMQAVGLSPNKLTNIWVPFVVAGTEALRPGGRLALVLPAELLQVSYASQLRGYLTDRFRRIDIVACNDLLFENVEQEVVLLLADQALASPSDSNICRVAMTETHNVEEITSVAPTALLAATSPKTIQHDNEKWLKYFLTEKEIEFMRVLRASAAITTFRSHASIDVGVVTGKNEFFVLNQLQVRSLGVEKYSMPLVSRSVQLQGAKLSKPDWNRLSKTGDRVHLLNLATMTGSRPTGKLRSYIEMGETQKFHTGYKCSIRTPWYVVPSTWIPDGFAFRQIYDFPRMVLNHGSATSTDTIHRISCKGHPEKLIANSYTHLLAASAEIEGRSYGGGVLELEPTEAERLLMPMKLFPAVPVDDADKLIRQGRLDEVLYENDRLILIEGLGLSKHDCAMLRGIWQKMKNRRFARSGRSRRKTKRPVSIVDERGKAAQPALNGGKR